MHYEYSRDKYFIRILEVSYNFLLYFIPIRITAGGYHAKSYHCCFLLTNSIAIVCGVVSKYFPHLVGVKSVAWITVMFLIWHIWRNAPIVFQKYRLSVERINQNRRYAHNILIIEIITLLVIDIFLCDSMFYMAVITTYVVTIMFIIARKEK